MKNMINFLLSKTKMTTLPYYMGFEMISAKGNGIRAVFKS